MDALPFEIDALNRLINYILNYYKSILVSELRETGLWHQGDWVDFQMIYDHSEIGRMKRGTLKSIRLLNRFLKNTILIFYERDGYSVKDTDELKCHLQLYRYSIESNLKAYQIIQSPTFNWNKLDSDRQQLSYENSEHEAIQMMNRIQIEDPQLILDMYSFLIDSCSYLVVYKQGN